MDYGEFLRTVRVRACGSNVALCCPLFAIASPLPSGPRLHARSSRPRGSGAQSFGEGACDSSAAGRTNEIRSLARSRRNELQWWPARGDRCGGSRGCALASDDRARQRMKLPMELTNEEGATRSRRVDWRRARAHVHTALLRIRKIFALNGSGPLVKVCKQWVE